MLREDVVQAAGDGRFHVYAETAVDEAIELLTGVRAGEADALGVFPAESANGHVCAPLASFRSRTARFCSTNARHVGSAQEANQREWTCANRFQGETE